MRVTAAYAVVLVVVAATMVALGPQVQGRVIDHLSTNLHNLRHGHLGTLIASAFVTSSGPGKGAELGGLEGADARCQTLAR